MIRRQRRHYRFCFKNSIVMIGLLKNIIGSIPELVFTINEDFDKGTRPMMMIATSITIDSAPLIPIARI